MLKVVVVAVAVVVMQVPVDILAPQVIQVRPVVKALPLVPQKVLLL
jgi:hypothetical protein